MARHVRSPESHVAAFFFFFFFFFFFRILGCEGFSGLGFRIEGLGLMAEGIGVLSGWGV